LQYRKLINTRVVLSKRRGSATPQAPAKQCGPCPGTQGRNEDQDKGQLLDSADDPGVAPGDILKKLTV